MSYGKNLGWIIKFDEGFANDLKKLGRPVQLRIKKYLDKLQREFSSPKDRGISFCSSEFDENSLVLQSHCGADVRSFTKS